MVAPPSVIGPAQLVFWAYRCRESYVKFEREEEEAAVAAAEVTVKPAGKVTVSTEDKLCVKVNDSEKVELAPAARRDTVALFVRVLEVVPVAAETSKTKKRKLLTSSTYSLLLVES